MNRRDFIKKSAIVAAASQLPLDALTVKAVPAAEIPVATSPVLSDAVMDEIAGALSNLSSYHSILSGQLYRAKEPIHLLADLTAKTLTDSAKKELVMKADNATHFVFKSDQMQDAVAKLLPYKEQLPEIIQKGIESHRLRWIGIKPNKYKPMPDPLEVLDKYQQGYYAAWDTEAAELRRSVVEKAQEQFGWSIENNEEWGAKRKEILASPEMRLQSLGTKLKNKDFRAYTIFNDPLTSSEGQTQTVQIVIDKKPRGWPWHDKIREHLEGIKKELDEGILPAVAGSVLLNDTRLLLKIDYSKPKAKEAIAFLQQFEPQKMNILSETATPSKTQPMLPHVEKLALRELRPMDGYSK